MQLNTYTFLQPNAASRAKLALATNLCKMRGQGASRAAYPQPEGALGECMARHGAALGDSPLGQALHDVAESLRQMAGVKYALEDTVRQNFLEPLAQIKETEIREVMFLRRKTESRRLDYDCKKRKKSQGWSRCFHSFFSQGKYCRELFRCKYHSVKSKRTFIFT